MINASSTIVRPQSRRDFVGSTWHFNAGSPQTLRALPALVALLLTLAFALSPTAALAAATTAAPGAFADVLPDLRDEVSARTADGLSAYRIDATLDAEAGTITGEADVTYRNDAAAPLGEVYFRLYPNAAYYAEGELAIAAASVAGTPVTPALDVADTALRVPLPAPVAPGATVDIVLAFATTVPVDSPGSYGIFSYDTVDGTWILADWHPILAVYEEEDGWQLDPATSFGDPTYAATALYDVTFAAPAELTVVASGLMVDESERDGLLARRYVAGPAREFTLVADDDYVAVSAEVDGTTVTAYSEPNRRATAAAQTALDIAVRALTVFGEWFGPYPYTELDLVQTRLHSALAVSWSGIVFFDGRTMFGPYAESDPIGFETVVAHEVAHLWWGAVVGSDSNTHTFINEGLATVSSILYLEQTASADVVAEELASWVLGPAWALLERGDAVVDVPIAEGQDPSVRAWATYGKATLGFLAIRRQIGDDAFLAALADFADEYRYGIAEPADLLAAFAAASGQDLAEPWRHWFTAAEMTAEEIESFAEAGGGSAAAAGGG